MPEAGPATPDDVALARRLIDTGDDPPQPLAADRRLGLAWALKDAAYAAWTSEPARASQAARALDQLRATPATPPAAPPEVEAEADADADAAIDAEVAALADWTAAIAALTRADMLEALEWLEAAVQAWRRLGRSHEAAQAQVPCIMALSVLGRFDEAADCARRAGQALREAGDTAAAARVSLNLGSLSMQRAAFADAVAPYREAAVLFAQVGDRAHSVMADIGLADACSMLGRFDEAEHLYERARQRAEHHGLPVLSATAQDGQATLALSRGEHGRALAGLEAARRAWAGLDLPHLRIEAEKGLADAYLEVRLLPEAIALYEDLVQTLREREAGATLPWTLAQLGRARALAGQPERAWAALDDADAAFVAQGIGVGRAAVAFARAELMLAQGQADAARALASEAAEGFEAGEAPTDADWARWLQAAAAQACGDADDALQRCDALLGKPELPPPLRVRAEVERAAAWRRLGRREAACLALERAIEDIELMHAALPGDELRRAFLADGTRAHAERLRFALEAADAAPTDAAAAQVLHWLERLKDRALGERLGRGNRHPVASSAQAPDISDDSASLRARLDAIYRREQRLTEDEDPPPAALIEEARRLERSLLERARRQRLYVHAVDPPLQPACGDAVAGWPAESPAGLLARLQQRLSAQRALLVYGALDDELFAVLVTARSIRLVRRLAGWSQVQAAVRALQFQIETMRAGAQHLAGREAQLAARSRAHLQRLYRLVWQPLATELAGCREIVVVPHGALHGLPFAALDDGEQALVDRHELGLAASARAALTSPADCPPPTGRAWLFGDASRLAHVAGELAAVAASLGAAACVAPDLAVLRQAAAQACVLHLACHASFRADSPLYSALHFGEGSLTAAEVEAMRLRAELVVLSACETARGDTGPDGRGADASIGLVRAFRMAGAARVLASHWVVDDATTAGFMATLYARWRAGGRLPAALRDAQRELRERCPHPWHWAAFSLHGASLAGAAADRRSD